MERPGVGRCFSGEAADWLRLWLAPEGKSSRRRKLARSIIPLIMCGGAGTRLWPASRENRPKQFLPLFGPRSDVPGNAAPSHRPGLFARPIVVTNGQYRFLVAEQLAAIGAEADVLLEPARRDSGRPSPPAPATRLHETTMPSWSRSPPITSSPIPAHSPKPAMSRPRCRRGRSDRDLRHAADACRRPNTATSAPVAPLAPGVFAVERFVEKPDAETAARYVAEGYLWNSGNFVFRAGFLLDEYRRFEPDSGAAVAAAVETAGTDLGFVTLDAEAFARATAKSIDYAVMERTARAAVMPVGYGWSDVGSWQAVWELSERDAAGNAAQGPAVFVDARDCYVAAKDSSLRCSALKTWSW